MNTSTSGQCTFRTVKGTTTERLEKAKAGGNQVPRITMLDSKKHFSIQETSSPIETVLLTNYESSPTSLEKVSSSAVKKTAVETGDPTLSKQHATSKHGNPDGIGMKPGANSLLDPLCFASRRSKDSASFPCIHSKWRSSHCECEVPVASIDGWSLGGVLHRY